MDLDSYIRHIPGFPKEGILFHDITPLLLNGDALRYTVDQVAEYAREKDVQVVMGAEARGFVIGAAVERANPANSHGP